MLVSIRLSCVDLSEFFRGGPHLKGLVYLLKWLSCLGGWLVLVLVMHGILSFFPAPTDPIPLLTLATQLVVRWVCHDLLGVQLDFQLPSLRSATASLAAQV